MGKKVVQKGPGVCGKRGKEGLQAEWQGPVCPLERAIISTRVSLLAPGFSEIGLL